mgnify:CR=1 FL=1
MRRIGTAWVLGAFAGLGLAAGAAQAAPQAWPGGGGWPSGWGSAPVASVRCESNDGRYRQCRTGGGWVELERQHSRAPCIEGRSWGRTPDGVWVDGGCRADFRVYAGGGYPGYPTDPGYPGDWTNAPGERFRCESRDGRAARCGVPGWGRVVLVRQLSRAPCIEGRSWGQDRGGVWVDGGCRAEFARLPGRGRWDDDRGWSERVRCESQDGRYRECAADVRGGVVLVRQLSRAPCIEGRSWGVTRRGLWVDGGCRAEFQTGVDRRW